MCQGLVVRDINPKVKAYVDFNTLLLRISETRQEYEELSQNIDFKNENSLTERIDVIKNRLEKSRLDGKVKNYYLKNIDRIGEIYLNTFKSWRADCGVFFEKCRYDLNEKLFLKLQNYAKSGNIVCVIGGINDLSFLKNRRVTVVDTSNIYDYCFLDLKGKGDFHPRVIWTLQDKRNATYSSCIFKPLNDKERIEFDELLNKVKESLSADENVFKFFKQRLGFLDFLETVSQAKDPLNSNTYGLYSTKTLSLLRKYTEQYFLRVPSLGFADMSPVGQGLEKLNALSVEEVHELCQHPETKRFLGVLVESWNRLNPHIYLAFSKMEGWKEQFEIKFANSYSNLQGFLERLAAEHYSVEEFIVEFGRERFNRLYQKTG
jgi:hypothetical protein